MAPMNAGRTAATIQGMRRKTILLDLVAVAVIVIYGWTVAHARRGAADPVWTKLIQRGSLRVGSDPGFQPFTQQVGGTWSGYDVDLTAEIARRLGLRVEFKAVSYDALYDTLAAGEVDLLASALPLAPEQGWRARFSTPYFDAGQVLVAASNSGITREDDLAGRRVGAALGSEGDTLLRALAKREPRVQRHSQYETSEAVLAALRAGMIDAAIVDAAGALGLTQRDRHFAIVRALTTQPYVLAMPIDAYQLQKEVDRVLDELRGSGYQEQLNRRWFGGAAPGSDGERQR